MNTFSGEYPRMGLVIASCHPLKEDLRPFVEDDFLQKTNFVGRRPSLEDNLRWKTTFGGRQPSVEDNLQWKTTFSGRTCSVEDIFDSRLKNFT